MLIIFLLTLFTFQNEFIPQAIPVWDYRAPAAEISLQPLKRGEKAFLIASLPDSYENQILQEIGYDKKTFSIQEWKQAILSQGHTISLADVRHEMAYFNSLDAVAEWLKPTLSPDQTEAFLAVLQKRGWVSAGDGRIGLPYKRLVCIVESGE